MVALLFVWLCHDWILFYLIVNSVGYALVWRPNQFSRLTRLTGAAEAGDVVCIGAASLSDSL